MNKKILLAITIISLLLAGCGKAVEVNTGKQNDELPLTATKGNSTADKSSEKPAPQEAADAVDYSQYVKKTWVLQNGTKGVSFCISQIIDGKITGRFTSNMPAVPSYYDLENLTGTINKDTGECEFSDANGNKGSMKLVFKSKDEIEATIEFANKAQAAEGQPKEGTFQFKPYNLKDIKGFSPIEDQSFMVNLNSWGNVKFVSGKLTAGNHIPAVFYLTNEDGDILYDFADTPFPYSVDVKAVSFADVNKDGLKDIIIIVADDYKDSANLGAPIAAICLQRAKGAFITDLKLSKEINDSGNNKDIKTIMSYLSQKSVK